MKKTLFALICLLFLSTRALAAMEYVEGTTTGNYYSENLNIWITRIVQVYVLSDTSVIDDLSYIVVGDGEKMIKGFLLEKGLPGEPNKDTREERRRLINLLEDSLILMTEAKMDGKNFTKHLSRFYSLDVKLKSSERGKDVKLVLIIHDYEKKKDLALHMNDKEVSELIALLEKVPQVLETLKKSEKKYPVLP